MILFTGKGTSGSWQIRGQQVGTALGATLKPFASQDDCNAADLIVLVKRGTPALLQYIRRSKRPWVWDLVDFYPQPECYHWDRERSIRWVRQQIGDWNPTAVIWPNQRMRDDCDDGRPGAVIYHHHRPGIQPNDIRDEVRVVAYEGSPKFLGKWGKRLIRECDVRGWDFYINHGKHHQWDICVAFRDAPYNGYAQRHWKSNVKLANCQGSGTPFIGHGEDGYTETATGGEFWCDHPKALSGLLDQLSCVDVRRRARAALMQRQFTLEDAVGEYRDVFDGLL